MVCTMMIINCVFFSFLFKSNGPKRFELVFLITIVDRVLLELEKKNESFESLLMQSNVQYLTANRADISSSCKKTPDLPRFKTFLSLSKRVLI